VVGGLVKKYQVRFAEEDLCQLHTHAPAATEFTGGTIKLLRTETESVERLSGQHNIIASSEYAVSFAGFMHPVEELVIAVGLVVSPFGYLAGHLFYILLQAPEFGESRKGLLEDGGGVRDLHLLLEVTNGEFAGPFDGAGGGLLEAGDDLHQG